MPPAFLNHRVPTACGTPTPTAASSLAVPAASLPKIAAAPLALPPAVDLVRTSAPAQNDPSAVFECSSQLPSRCCDDHLNPPWLPLTPFCLSSGDLRGVDFLAPLRDEREDLSGEVALQGSNGVEFGMPFCDPTSYIVLRSLVGS